MTRQELKKEIFDKVREYNLLSHKIKKFIPCKTNIPYACRVFDGKKSILVKSTLDIESGKMTKNVNI